MFTPVGLGARPASAAIRGGISRAAEGSVYNRRPERQVLAAVPCAFLRGLARVDDLGMTALHFRLLQLGVPALTEAAEGLGGPLPILVALPAAAPDERDPIGDGFLAHLAAEAEVVPAPESRAFRQGGAGVMSALAAALELLGTGGAHYVLVGGVDSMVDARRLETANAEGRVKASDSMDYFIPGEGAAFLLLGAPGRPKRSNEKPLADVVAVGLGEEPGHRYSEKPYRGEGLAAAFSSLFQQLPERFPSIGCVYAGFNGENLPAKEWAVAAQRNAKRFEQGDVAIHHPASCVGDAGAALGPIMLACAAIGIQRGYRSSPCLVWSTSDREPRGAAVLQAHQGAASLVG